MRKIDAGLTIHETRWDRFWARYDRLLAAIGRWMEPEETYGEGLEREVRR